MTAADPAEILDLAPELRMASYAFREEYGQPAAVIGRVPGQVSLLASGPMRLTVATPWGVIAAAGPRDDDAIEVARMQRPGQRDRLTVSDAVAGLGPRWTGAGLRSARVGSSLLISSELPEGSGVGASAAIETAIARCLGDRETAGHEVPAAPCAMLAGLPLPFDLATAGLRLLIIDTGVRDAAGVPRAEASPVAAAARALESGDLTAFGRLLTVAHQALASHEAQHAAVTAAMRAGALGARAITDRPGRPACALVPADRLADVRAAVRARFARSGFRAPRFLTFTPPPQSRMAWHDGSRLTG